MVNNYWPLAPTYYSFKIPVCTVVAKMRNCRLTKPSLHTIIMSRVQQMWNCQWNCLGNAFMFKKIVSTRRSLITLPGKYLTELLTSTFCLIRRPSICKARWSLEIRLNINLIEIGIFFSIHEDVTQYTMPMSNTVLTRFFWVICDGF